MKNKLAVILPSRGTVFSETIDELLTELKHHDYEIFWSHRKPIPDCFEEPTQLALADKSFTHLLYIEEDMILSPRLITGMLEEDKTILACDYPVTKSGVGATKYIDDNRALYTGCGVMLVKRDYLDQLKAPIWRDDIRWGVKNQDGKAIYTAKESKAVRYGKQDITFGLRAYLLNEPIHIHHTVVGQRKIVTPGEQHNNQGFHEVEEWTELIGSIDNRDVEVDYELVEDWV